MTRPPFDGAIRQERTSMTNKTMRYLAAYASHAGRLERKLSVLVLACILAANAGGWARPPLSYEDVPSDFVHLTIADGLSQGSAFSILQDDQGFIWIGTEDGLNRYDGHTFKIYRPSNAPNSLTNKPGRILFKDSRGVLWIGTLHGLNRYNQETDDLTRYLRHAGDPKTLSNNSIYSIS